MRKQGAILLGNGGDNSNHSSGTFYEGAMTAPGTFPTQEVNQAIQANVVAAGYDVQRLAVSATDKTAAPNGLQTFSPGSVGYTTVTFVNTTKAPINDLVLSIEAPKGWKASVLGAKEASKKIDYAVLPGQTVVANFAVTAGSREWNGDLVAKAGWSAPDGKAWSETAIQKVRNVAPVKINEFRVGDGVNKTNSFIELYNASDKEVDIAGWELIHHAAMLPYFSTIKVPSGTKLAPKAFYLLGLSTSGLAVDAAKGDKTLYVRDITGIKAGDEITVGTGANAEKHKVAAVIRNEPEPAANANPTAFSRTMVPLGSPTTLWQPLPEGPVITIPKGSTQVPVAYAGNFKAGAKMAIGYGAKYPAPVAELEKYEVVTVTKVGKPGTQAWLAYDAKPGDRNIKVSSVENISPGDVIRLDIDSEGHGIEYVKVKKVGTASSKSPGRGPMTLEEAGTGLTLTKPLKYAHSANMPFSCSGTGISFTPATKFDHSSNEPVLALAFEIVLEEPLKNNHPIDDVICDPTVTTAGYQGEIAPDQLYGGPVFGRMGNMTLYDADGHVVDCLNWGSVVDPMLAEGYMGQSGVDQEGSFIHLRVENNNRNWSRIPNAPVLQDPNLSAGRYPDGSDTDDNQVDFKFQLSTNLYEAVKAGSRDITVTETQGVRIGHLFNIGYGKDQETVTVATIGKPRVITNTVTIGDRTREIRTTVMDLTLGQPLKADHAAGASITDGTPTPGYANRF
jgi:hypothetical protein